MKKISIVLAAVLAFCAITLTSCGGMIDDGATDGTPKVTLETNKKDSGKVTDAIDGSARNMR